MKTITIYSHKGGVGKTTSTILMATNFEKYLNKKVAIIDTDDTQWSLAEMKNEELRNLNSNLGEEELERLLKKKEIVDYDTYMACIDPVHKNEEKGIYYINDLIEHIKSEYNYDYVFIDLGNRSLLASLELFKLIDYFIIPFGLDNQELKQAFKMYNLVDEKFTNAKKRMLMLKITKSERDLEKFNSIKEVLNSQGIEVFKYPILDRTKYNSHYRSFYIPLPNSDKEEKEYSLINLLKELEKELKN